MRKLFFVAGAIGLAAISTHARVAAQSPAIQSPIAGNHPAAAITARPVSPDVKYQMFLPTGTPVRPSVGLDLKEAGKASFKNESKQEKNESTSGKPQPKH
jgi:hypothetical protein